MKKVALVTCYFQHNYGSQLQALATQMICDKLGYDNETICIDGLLPEINRAKYKYFLSRLFDIDTVKDKMALVRKKYAAKTNPVYAANLRLRDSLFEKFARTQFRLSDRYASKTELGNKAHDYDAFIVGSDQLWLPSNISADYYTLNFVPQEVRKIAYATSFGVSSLPPRQEAMAKAFLPRLHSVMVRETSGQALVRRLINKEVPVVADPTLLFTAEEWSQKIQQRREDAHDVNINKDYILCYFLGNNPEHRAFARRLAEKTGCSIVQLPNLDEYIRTDEGFADYPLYGVDPIDFVSLISKARYVLTDSFHCTVFSTLFRREFFSFRRYRDDGAVSTNSRLYSLLETLGLTERLLHGEEVIEACLQKQIDYAIVHDRISKLRERSVDLLKQALVQD